MQQHPIILFDGVCNFCNCIVNFIIKRDKKSNFRFAPLQSTVAQEFLENIPSGSATLSTIIFIEKDKIYSRSTAALRICKHLNGLWPLMYGFIIVPKFIRDFIYNWIAKNRFKWFGKREECMIPTPDVRSRFLNETV